MADLVILLVFVLGKTRYNPKGELPDDSTSQLSPEETFGSCGDIRGGKHWKIHQNRNSNKTPTLDHLPLDFHRNFYIFLHFWRCRGCLVGALF